MATEVKVPTLGESVTEATVGQWLKKPGEAVKADEPIVGEPVGPNSDEGKGGTGLDIVSPDDGETAAEYAARRGATMRCFSSWGGPHRSRQSRRRSTRALPAQEWALHHSS